MKFIRCSWVFMLAIALHAVGQTKEEAVLENRNINGSVVFSVDGLVQGKDAKRSISTPFILKDQHLAKEIWTAIGMGNFRLHNPLRVYFPDAQGTWVDSVRIQHAFDHTSGLPPFHLEALEGGQESVLNLMDSNFTVHPDQDFYPNPADFFILELIAEKEGWGQIPSQVTMQQWLEWQQVFFKGKGVPELMHESLLAPRVRTGMKKPQAYYGNAWYMDSLNLPSGKVRSYIRIQRLPEGTWIAWAMPEAKIHLVCHSPDALSQATVEGLVNGWAETLVGPSFKVYPEERDSEIIIMLGIIGGLALLLFITTARNKKNRRGFGASILTTSILVILTCLILAFLYWFN